MPKDPTTPSSNPMGKKPRVPVGPRPPSSSGAPKGSYDPTLADHSADPTVAAEPTGPRSKAPVRKPSLAWRLVKTLFVLLFLGALAGAGLVAYVLHHYGRDLPDTRNLLTQWRPPQTTRILARDGSVLAELFLERRTVVPLERLPRHTVMAFLAAEDAEFYRHPGFNYLGLLRALWVNVRHREATQGASTITQQVVKNVLLSPERSLARKVRELLLSLRIERELTKNQILYLYLNQIAFGHGRNGVEEAALFYFGRHVQELTLGQSAILAGIPKNPSHYSPRINMEASLRRRRWILSQMVEKQFITQAEADAAAAEPVVLAEENDEAAGLAPEAVEAARTALRQYAGENAVREGGYTVQTTIDPELQRWARDAVRAGLRELDARQGYTGPLLGPDARRTRGRAGYVLPAEGAPDDDRLLPGHTYAGEVVATVDPDPAQRRPGSITVRVGHVRGRIPWVSVSRYVRGDDTPGTFAPVGATVRVTVDRAATPDAEVGMHLELGPQAAMVVLDPDTREVRALVGGYDALAGGYDRASRAQRQPGSSFKTFLYSYALSARRLTLASTFDPNPACFGSWCPRDHSHRSGAPLEPAVRLREALAFSRNIVAARVVTDPAIGALNLAQHAARLGIQSPLDPVPTLALGSSSVTPLELTNAYATFAARGRYAQPRLLRSITAPGGRLINMPEPPAPAPVLTPEEAYLVTSMLTSVVDHGTATRARSLHRPVAGKTGTTNESRDAWFVGYTTELVAGVWVGFDDRQPLGRGEEGARSAVPIWVNFFRAYLDARHPPPVDFPRPAGIVSARIDPATGLLAPPEQSNAIEEFFLPGTEPHDLAPTDAGAPAVVPAVEAGASAPPEGTSEGPGEGTADPDAGRAPVPPVVIPDAGPLVENEAGAAP